MSRKADLTAFAGYHMAQIVQLGGTIPPEMAYSDIHAMIDEYCEAFRLRKDEYTQQLERALRTQISLTYPGEHDDEVLKKCFETALRNAE